MSDSALRIDKWLWYARFFKTRSLATAAVKAGRIHLNGKPLSKPSQDVKVGDELVIGFDRTDKWVRIEALGTRRGPAPEAQALYEDHTPAPAAPTDGPAPVAERERGSGRPTKRDRRAMEKFTGDP